MFGIGDFVPRRSAYSDCAQHFNSSFHRDIAVCCAAGRGISAHASHSKIAHAAYNMYYNV